MELYQHFRKEEHPFIDQVLEWKEMVSRQYAPKLTDFLDPREQQIVQSITGGDGDVRVFFFGGAPFVERKRAFLAPPYIDPKEEDYGIVLFAVRYPAKFVSLEHRDVLGALMSLGLRRGKFGDILVRDGEIQFLLLLKSPTTSACMSKRSAKLRLRLSRFRCRQPCRLPKRGRKERSRCLL